MRKQQRNQGMSTVPGAQHIGGDPQTDTEQKKPGQYVTQFHERFLAD